MMEWVKGNLLDSDCDYICHQVNCQGRMGSGIAKQIRERWPEVYSNYLMKYHNSLPEILLGDIQIIYIQNTNIPRQCVINLFSQQYFGYDGKRYTSYDAFWECLHHIKYEIPKGSKIGFPKNIGCGLGGANWQIIETMIYEVLDDDFKVYIYYLEDEKHA